MSKVKNPHGVIGLASQIPVQLRTRVQSPQQIAGERLDRLVRWSFFSVALSLTPVFILWLLRPRGTGIREVLASGELLVVSLVIAFTAAGDVALSELPASVRIARLSMRTVALSISIIAGLIATCCYVMAALGATAKTNSAYAEFLRHVAPMDVFVTSIMVFVLAVLIGGAIVWATTPWERA